MTQRTLARLFLWALILTGIPFVLLVFVVPRYAAIFADSEMALPLFAQLLLNLSTLTTHYGFYIAPLYTVLFIAVVIWLYTAKSKPLGQIR